MHIVVISHSYPTSKTIDFVFVDQLCREFSDKGLQISVIAPQSLTKCLFRGIPLSNRKSVVKTLAGNNFTLYRPFWISLGNRFTKFVGGSFNLAVQRAFCRIKDHIDIIYAHFWAQAIAIIPYAKSRNIPLFVVAGEGELDTHKKISPEKVKEVKDYVSGVICVATKSKNESIAAGFTTDKMCIVIPNAINPNLFYKRNRSEMRAKYGYNKEDFIIAFVGQWNSRKGINRLSDALTKIANPNIKAMFIGRGDEAPTYKLTIFKGTVNHDILPEYLCCADIFVLPTNNEGCSNAIIEAMACGLPIVSANKEFNWDVLNEKNSILVDPMNVNEISNAIKQLYDNRGLRDSLSQGALQTAKELTISSRAEKILDYIKSKI